MHIEYVLLSTYLICSAWKLLENDNETENVNGQFGVS